MQHLGILAPLQCTKVLQNQEMYTGEGVTHNLVTRLLQQADVLYRGHHIGMDNVFSFPKLFMELFAKGMAATGTVRKNGKGPPVDCIKAKLSNQEVCERRSGELLCVSDKDK